MAKQENPSIRHTGPDAEPVGPFYDDQERAAESTKDSDSVKAVADPTNRGDQPPGWPKWPADRADKGPGVE